MVKRKITTACVGCRLPFDWRKQNRLLTLQNEDTANEQVVFRAYNAPGGESHNMVWVLKLVTDLVKGTKCGVKIKGLAEDSREKVA